MACVCYDQECTQCEFTSYEKTKLDKCPCCSGELETVVDWDEWQDHND